PRVRISFERREGDRTVEVELPFVVAVLGDFAGSARRRPRPLAERSFIAVDRDNFDEVLARIAPGLDLRVENRLVEDESDLRLSLDFRALEDFEPRGIVRQVPALAKLLAVRNKLASLVSAFERSGALREKLETALDRIATERTGSVAPATQGPHPSFAPPRGASSTAPPNEDSRDTR
ncbi:MAG TPA: type VI secretion system contractile sheath small subunit, partial [Planctomycetota bacterium]|nr:type VI secretion system contractile sheath small subunit [Planctomycetota bacterium]